MTHGAEAPNVSKALYPGSFDPPHNGHLAVVETAAALFGPVVVAVMHNPQKATSLFTAEERVALWQESVGHLTDVEVVACDGLVVDAARDLGVDMIVKGLRVASDFEVELQMAQTNFAVSGVRTVFLPTAPEHAFLASRYIREIAAHGGDISGMVPPIVAKRLAERFAS